MSQSFFTRQLDAGCERVEFNTSFRLGPSLFNFVDTVCYHDTLETRWKEDRPLDLHFKSVAKKLFSKRSSLIWIDVQNSTTHTPPGRYSVANDLTAKSIIAKVEELVLMTNHPPWDISEHPGAGFDKVRSSTFDSAQSSEAQVVFLDIPNTKSPGFLAVQNRMTTAYTRPKIALFIFGDKQALKSLDSKKKSNGIDRAISCCEKAKCITTIEEIDEYLIDASNKYSHLLDQRQMNESLGATESEYGNAPEDADTVDGQATEEASGWDAAGGVNLSAEDW